MIAVIDSGVANISSVMFALERLGQKPVLVSNRATLINAEKVILPGVGSATAAMRQLQDKNLITVIKELKQPVLGICLGMQLLFSHSEEGDADMLGIIPDKIKKFDKTKCKIVPHMGWNTVTADKNHPLTYNLEGNNYFYFVHSYYADIGKYTIGKADYGTNFSAIVAQGNFMGCQFHPERSGNLGEKILKNFLEMKS